MRPSSYPRGFAYTKCLELISDVRSFESGLAQAVHKMLDLLRLVPLGKLLAGNSGRSASNS